MFPDVSGQQVDAGGSDVTFVAGRLQDRDGQAATGVPAAWHRGRRRQRVPHPHCATGIVVFFLPLLLSTSTTASVEISQFANQSVQKSTVHIPIYLTCVYCVLL